jgi:hypothetical protein
MARTQAAGIAEFETIRLPVAVAVFETQCLRPAARVKVRAKRVQVTAKKSAAIQHSDKAAHTCCHQMCCCVR